MVEKTVEAVQQKEQQALTSFANKMNAEIWSEVFQFLDAHNEWHQKRATCNMFNQFILQELKFVTFVNFLQFDNIQVLPHMYPNATTIACYFGDHARILKLCAPKHVHLFKYRGHYWEQDWPEHVQLVSCHLSASGIERNVGITTIASRVTNNGIEVAKLLQYYMGIISLKNLLLADHWYCHFNKLLSVALVLELFPQCDELWQLIFRSKWDKSDIADVMSIRKRETIVKFLSHQTRHINDVEHAIVGLTYKVRTSIIFIATSRECYSLIITSPN